MKYAILFVLALVAYVNTQSVICPVGTFSANGYSPCCPCFPGTYSNVEGTTVCPPCAAGDNQLFNINSKYNI